MRYQQKAKRRLFRCCCYFYVLCALACVVLSIPGCIALHYSAPCHDPKHPQVEIIHTHMAKRNLSKGSGVLAEFSSMFCAWLLEGVRFLFCFEFDFSKARPCSWFYLLPPRCQASSFLEKTSQASICFETVISARHCFNGT